MVWNSIDYFPIIFPWYIALNKHKVKNRLAIALYPGIAFISWVKSKLNAISLRCSLLAPFLPAVKEDQFIVDNLKSPNKLSFVVRDVIKVRWCFRLSNTVRSAPVAWKQLQLLGRRYLKTTYRITPQHLQHPAFPLPSSVSWRAGRRPHSSNHGLVCTHSTLVAQIYCPEHNHGATFLWVLQGRGHELLWSVQYPGFFYDTPAINIYHLQGITAPLR